MRVAITGAGGFLGRAVLGYLIDAGNEMVVLSRSLKGTTGVEVVNWDVRQDWKHTAVALRHVEVVIHLAAYIPGDHSDAEEATRCFEVNALGTLTLLRASVSAGIRRFIYVSSASVLSPRSEFVSEDDPVGCGHSPYYSGSKVLGEIYVRAAMERGLDGLIVRPSAIYGPGMKTGVLWSFAERLRNGLPIYLQSGGRFKADYVWRDDVAGVLSKAVTGKQHGEVNLGSGQAHSVLDVANLLLVIFNAEKSLIKHAASGSQVGGIGFSPVDITRARNWFNFQPISLHDGLVRWFATGAS